MPKFSFAEIAPAFFILLFLVFALTQKLKEKNSNSIDELKEKNPEDWRKAVKRSAISKLIGYCLIGVIWLGIVALNLPTLPRGAELNATMMSSLGVFFICIGIWSYFREIKKIK